MDYSGKDVLTEVLIRLPAKSLLRFKCVNRLWHHVISDPEFAKAHLRTSPSEKLLVPVDYLHGLDSLDGSVFTKLYNPPNIWGGHFSILGSCHGLLCLRATYCRQFFLYNPTTRGLRQLPKSRSLPCTNSDEYREFIRGFGYDTLKDDYKLVICTYHYQSQTQIAEIYSLRSNSWRSIPEVDHYHLYDAGVYSNGFLHWATRERRVNTIVSFDIAAEEFRDALLPMPSFRLQGGRVQLSVSGGGTLIVYSTKWPRIEVWIMKDRGLNSTWTELCRFSNEPLMKVPCLLLRDCVAPLIKDGKTLLCVRRWGFPLISIYDPTEGSFKTFPHPGSWYEINTYIESLVSVHVANRPLKEAGLWI